MTATRTVTSRVSIPDTDNATVRAGGHVVQLTNLRKIFWPELGYTKRDLLQYYTDVSTALVPHLKNRAMVMKRYPNGIHGKCFFMKRTPSPRPEWLQTCEILHKSNNLIDFPMVQTSPHCSGSGTSAVSISTPGMLAATTSTGPTISTSISTRFGEPVSTGS